MNPYSSKPFKALILAAGRGKRLEERTIETNKCLIPFNGRPLIEYSLENAILAHVDEIVIVVGYLAEEIINKYGTNYKGTTIKYCIQKEQKGLVHAIETSKNIIGDADFLLLLGDEFLIRPNYGPLLNLFFNENYFAVCGVIITKNRGDISKTYSILFDDGKKRVYRLIEKPKNPSNNLMGTGNVIFKNAIFDFIPLTPVNQIRGEKELPDLIQCAIDDNRDVTFYTIGSEYVNVNTPEEITRIRQSDLSEK
ncbi:MAG: nucleotidyltransferase family protein [Candidatus Altiarchaeota archaeon]|nr:nucleotidyltransferase family protein [Candidatus Altiarchaeota archaeon]